jgi:integrase
MPDIPGEKPPIEVERWLREKANKTVGHYKHYLSVFSDVTGLKPDRFLAFTKTHEPVEVLDLVKKAGEDLEPAVRFNYEIAMRSFLRHNGYNSLPRSKIGYMPEEWHRGYKREEIQRLLSYLDSKPHKLYVLLAVETGLRARTVLAVQYKHIQEDYEAGTIPCAVRLEPRFYGRAKSAGFTFIGATSASLVKEMISDGLIKPRPETFLVPLSYTNIFDVVKRAMVKANLDPKIQASHGLRKYFENGLDRAGVDHERKQILEGHFAGTRAKHYTDRDWDQLRSDYRRAYPYLDVQSGDVEVAQKLQSSEDKITALERKVAELTLNLQKLLEKKQGSS